MQVLVGCLVGLVPPTAVVHYRSIVSAHLAFTANGVLQARRPGGRVSAEQAALLQHRGALVVGEHVGYLCMGATHTQRTCVKVCTRVRLKRCARVARCTNVLL